MIAVLCAASAGETAMRTGFVWHERYFWFDTGRGLPVLPG